MDNEKILNEFFNIINAEDWSEDVFVGTQEDTKPPTTTIEVEKVKHYKKLLT